MSKFSLDEIVEGIRCEECYPRAFGEKGADTNQAIKQSNRGTIKPTIKEN